MDGVIVEYKGQNRMHIVEPAIERRSREYHNAKRANKAKMAREHRGLVGSVERERTHRPWYRCGTYTDTKSWKNQKHAHKGWMRHLHRISVSVRLLTDRCIYPNMNSFERRQW